MMLNLCRGRSLIAQNKWKKATDDSCLVSLNIHQTWQTSNAFAETDWKTDFARCVIGSNSRIKTVFETQDVQVNDGGTFEISEEKARTPGTGICIFYTGTDHGDSDVKVPPCLGAAMSKCYCSFQTLLDVRLPFWKVFCSTAIWNRGKEVVSRKRHCEEYFCKWLQWK